MKHHDATRPRVADGIAWVYPFRSGSCQRRVGHGRIIAAEPTSRFGKPEEVAAAVWLCSEAASLVTGVECRWMAIGSPRRTWG